MKKINDFDESSNEVNASRYRLKKRNRVKRAALSVAVILVCIVGISLGSNYFGANKSTEQTDGEHPTKDTETAKQTKDEITEVNPPENPEQTGKEDNTNANSESSTEDTLKENKDEPSSVVPLDNLPTGDEEKEIDYTVKAGDSLYKLSLEYYNSAQYQDFLAWHNDLQNSDDLQIGQMIKIPFPPPNEWHNPEDESEAVAVANTVRIHEVVAGDTLYKISLQYYNSSQYQELLAETNDLDNPMELKVGDKLEIPPIK